MERSCRGFVYKSCLSLSCRCSEYWSWVLLCTPWRASVRLNVCAVAESSADWHLCSVPLHSKVQFVSKFLMFFCMAGLETLSVDGELSVDIQSSHHMFMGELDTQKIKIK